MVLGLGFYIGNTHTHARATPILIWGLLAYMAACTQAPHHTTPHPLHDARIDLYTYYVRAIVCARIPLVGYRQVCAPACMPLHSGNTWGLLANMAANL